MSSVVIKSNKGGQIFAAGSICKQSGNKCCCFAVWSVDFCEPFNAILASRLISFGAEMRTQGLEMAVGSKRKGCVKTRKSQRKLVSIGTIPGNLKFVRWDMHAQSGFGFLSSYTGPINSITFAIPPIVQKQQSCK